MAEPGEATDYVVKRRDPDGGLVEAARFRSSRAFAAGEILNLPLPPDGRSRETETKGYLYRVLEPSGAEGQEGVLVVEYLSAWEPGLPQCRDLF